MRRTVMSRLLPAGEEFIDAKVVEEQK